MGSLCLSLGQNSRDLNKMRTEQLKEEADTLKDDGKVNIDTAVII